MTAHPADRPYRLIVTDDPCETLAQGEMRYFARIIDAANAFAKAEEPFKTIIYDDGCEARELNRDEQWMLEACAACSGTTSRTTAPRPRRDTDTALSRTRMPERGHGTRTV